MHVTVRGAQAEKLLHTALKVKEHELKAANFSDEGKYFTHSNSLSISALNLLQMKNHIKLFGRVSVRVVLFNLFINVMSMKPHFCGC